MGIFEQETVAAEEYANTAALQELGSYNHSYLQAKIAALIFNIRNCIALTEPNLDSSGLDSSNLSIRLKDIIKPAICIYSKHKLNFIHDIIKMAETPSAATEIPSPLQGVQTIIDKFKIYFQLSIQSCWLFIQPLPPLPSIHSWVNLILITVLKSSMKNSACNYPSPGFSINRH